MAISSKSLVLAAELKDNLEKRFAVVSQSFDTDGAPLILVGDGTAGSQSMLVKVKQFDPIGTNAIGQSVQGYSPHICQVVLETSTIANVALMTEANEIAALGEVLKLGTRVELYMSANGNAVDASDIISGNLKATWDADLKYKLMDAQ